MMTAAIDSWSDAVAGNECGGSQEALCWYCTAYGTAVSVAAAANSCIWDTAKCTVHTYLASIGVGASPPPSDTVARGGSGTPAVSGCNREAVPVDFLIGFCWAGLGRAGPVVTSWQQLLP